MIKFLLYIIVTVAIFPFAGHLAILTLLSSVLLVVFLMKINVGTLVLNKYDYHKNSYYVLFMLFLFSYSLVSFLWSADVRGWLNYNIYLYIATVSVVACNYLLKTSNDFLEMLNYISLLSIIHNIIGWINITTGKYILSTSPLIPDFKEKGNPLSLFNNTNDFATFLVFAIFMNIVIIINSNDWKRQLFYSLNIMSSLYLLYATMSRANYLALFLGLFTFILLFSKRKQLILLLVGVSGIMGGILYLSPPIFRITNNFLTSNIFNSGDVIRVNLVKNGFIFLKNSIGWGVGAGNIPFYLENKNYFDTYNIHSLHNWWLDILVTYGVFVFFLYLVFYGKLMVGLNSMKKDTEKLIRTISISFMSFLSAYVIGSGSSSSNFPIIWIWIAFSIMIAFMNVDYSSRFGRENQISLKK